MKRGAGAAADGPQARGSVRPFTRRAPADAASDGTGTGDSPQAAVGPDDFEAEALSHMDRLYSTALRLTRNASAAEDLVQDTYVKALRFAGRFEPGTNLRAWLFTILHNTFRNTRRGAIRDPVEVDSDVVEQAPASVDDGTPEAALLRNTLNVDLKAALDDLPDAFRQAVWLRDVQEFSYAEIAQMLDVPIGTVMSRIARGRRTLFQRLTKTGFAPGLARRD